jgi:hypothetical protein
MAVTNMAETMTKSETIPPGCCLLASPCFVDVVVVDVVDVVGVGVDVVVVEVVVVLVEVAVVVGVVPVDVVRPEVKELVVLGVVVLLYPVVERGGVRVGDTGLDFVLVMCDLPLRVLFDVWVVVIGLPCAFAYNKGKSELDGYYKLIHGTYFEVLVGLLARSRRIDSKYHACLTMPRHILQAQYPPFERAHEVVHPGMSQKIHTGFLSCTLRVYVDPAFILPPDDSTLVCGLRRKNI